MDNAIERAFRELKILYISLNPLYLVAIQEMRHLCKKALGVPRQDCCSQSQILTSIGVNKGFE